MAQPSELEVKYQLLLNKSALLDQQLEEFKSRGVTSDYQPEIKALHAYNDMKDLAQAVLGHLANVERVTVTELHERYNLPLE